MGEYFVDIGVALAVDIQGQRLGTRVDAGNHLVDLAVANHRQQRTKNLFVHDAGVRCNAVEQRWLDEAGTFHHCAADQGLSTTRLGVIEQRFDARCMTCVHHMRQMRAALLLGQSGAIRPCEFGAATLDPWGLDTLVHIDVVRGNAGLPGIGELGPHDVAGCQLQIGAGVDNRRALAAELQRDAGQVLCRCRHDELADRRAACEEDVIKRQLLQSLRHVGFALEDGDLVFCEDFPDHLGDQG